jgi:hypothetical protein
MRVRLGDPMSQIVPPVRLERSHPLRAWTFQRAVVVGLAIGGIASILTALILLPQ